MVEPLSLISMKTSKFLDYDVDGPIGLQAVVEVGAVVMAILGYYDHISSKSITLEYF